MRYSMTRRRFLRNAALASGGLMFQGLLAFQERALSGAGLAYAQSGNGAYGTLVPTKAMNTGDTFLALPEGFHYTVIGKAGSPMSDSFRTPIAHDGMATFVSKGELRIVRNHEINNRLGKPDIAFGNREFAYDKMAAGGTTTLIINPQTREVIKDFVSLSGTLQNCAGGPTPWGSWVSCEETTLGTTKAKTATGQEYGGFSQPHGYCFEVPAFSNAPAPPVPLKAMGRFVHEAIAVDPKTGIVYETEDNNPAGFYRFLPQRKNRLAEGGRLQMLAIKDKPQYDTRTGQSIKQRLPVVWVEIPNPDPAETETSPLAVFKQGQAAGGAAFARLEGCCYGNQRIYFTATSGGDNRLGQVWEYQPRGKNEGELTLLYQSTDRAVLDMPDNLTVSPRGGLVLCEDGREDNYLRGLTKDGRIFDFAKNIVPGFEAIEFAGATFTPDGETLFVNIQAAGLTLAIWGRWKDGAL